MDYNMAVIPGDGIGLETVKETGEVLGQVGGVYGRSFNYTGTLVGRCPIDAYGVPLTEEVLETAGENDAAPLEAAGGDMGSS